MTILRVNDQQQDLSNLFVKKAKNTLSKGKFDSQKKESIYLMGQDMGFCNDEIRILIEDIIPPNKF